MNICFYKFFFLACIFFFCTANLYAESQYLFNRQGTRYTIPQGKFPKWDDMLRRWHRTQGLLNNSCEPGLFNACYLNELQALIATHKNNSDWEKINLINDFVNEIRYQEDIYIYGISDYWAVPHEFFDNEWGDCEDYSITKYYALKQLGIKLSDLQIAVVKDVNVNLFHAILIVKHKERYYALDNRLSSVIALDRLNHYQPVYTINEQYWWFYR